MSKIIVYTPCLTQQKRIFLFIVKLTKYIKASHLVYIYSFFYYQQNLLLLYYNLTIEFQCFVTMICTFKLHSESRFIRCGYLKT